MNTKTLYSSKTDKWATPQTFFDELNREFDFNLDPCADATNHKCEKYFTEEENGLLQDWGGVPGILQPTIWQQYKRLGG